MEEQGGKLTPIYGHLGEKEDGGKARKEAAVNCETLVLNHIMLIVYGRELEWDLQELYAGLVHNELCVIHPSHLQSNAAREYQCTGYTHVDMHVNTYTLFPPAF